MTARDWQQQQPLLLHDHQPQPARLQRMNSDASCCLRGRGGGSLRSLSDDDEAEAEEQQEQAQQQHVYVSVVRKQPCRLTCLFDPVGCFSYCWLAVVAIAFCYNISAISYRFAFAEVTPPTVCIWFPLDYTADAIYLLDLLLGFRTAFFQDGVLQTSPRAIRDRHLNSSVFYMDCLALLPLDLLYLSFGFVSLFRLIRLVKWGKFCRFIDITERHTNHPNTFRLLLLLLYVLLACHCNACFLYKVSRALDAGGGEANGSQLQSSAVSTYLRALSLSCSCLLQRRNASSALLPGAQHQDVAAVVDTIQHVLGLFLLAGVIAYCSNVVAHMNSDRKRFQFELDSVKEYMCSREVPAYLQMKVIRWFDYLWKCKGSGADAAVLDCLPDRLKAEIAIQVHLDTLKRVAIFRNTEPGFLCELVLRLKPMLFSPGDYVIRKGEVGREMYIVDRGRLSVVNEETGTVFATLLAGTYFGEISLLDVASEGNRRTASVVSVGYCELLVLAKKDIYEVLQDYPRARERIESLARKRLDDIRKATSAEPKNSAGLPNARHSQPNTERRNSKQQQQQRERLVGSCQY